MKVERVRGLSAAAGAVALVEGLVLAVVLAGSGRRMLLPVTAEFGASVERLQRTIATIDVSVAAVILCLLVGVARTVVALPALWPRYSTALGANRHGIRWLELSFTAPITVFLIAQLNGIRDVTALVPVYAITAGAVLLGAVQERSPVRDGHPLLPLCLQAAIEIVPWGVTAFSQIGADLSGAPLPGIVRIITLALLAAAFLRFLAVWHEQRSAERGDTSTIGEQRYIVISLIGVSAFAWLVVLGIALPA